MLGNQGLFRASSAIVCPANSLALGIWGSQEPGRRGNSRPLLRAMQASLVSSSPKSPWPFPKYNRLLSVLCYLGQVLLIPRWSPPQHTHSPPDIRKKHVRMGGPRSHPLPLPFQAEGNRTGGMGSPTVGRGGSQQAGSRRGRCTLTTRPLVESGTLSATDIWPAQASHLWSKEESRGHELRVECSAFRTEGEKCKSLVAGSHLLHPCMWVVSSAPSICQRGQTGPSPEERRQSR